MIELNLLFELSIFGLIIGFVSAFFGIGGGTLLVPSLMYLGFEIKYAIGISVVQMVFSSTFASYLNVKKGMSIAKEGLILGLGGFIGAQGSGFVVHFFPSMVLNLIFLFSVSLAIMKFFKSPEISDKEEINSKIVLFLVGMFVGLIAISIGVGGGLFLTPILVGFLHYDVKKAVSMSLFYIIFSSTSGFISLARFGYIHYDKGLIVGITSLIGVYFGIKMSHKTNKKLHKKLILTLYIIIFCMTFNKLFF
ncbi:sulfite exporter TauE/SafE family protein [Sulfurospirillum arcachonense]|uniref:sulfite exporter TauE/SafE family protein n=1 Tax=Sulfurospirillum arcachonense TaxID=57666 RepID=UPI0004AFAE5E|nr:sulfite exporter TauE/SafE family protein [Sulfurospirillum arcachonense]